MEKAELMLDIIDLLDAVNYEGYTEKLEDILMTIDNYPVSESLSLIESILSSSLIDCCKTYGLYINEENYDLLKLSSLYDITNGLFKIISDTDSEYEFLDTEDDSCKGKMISYLQSSVILDFHDLNELIDYADDDLVYAIENKDNLLESEQSNKINIINRLKNSKILERAVNSRSLILASGFGYDFYEVLSLFKKELLAIDDLKQRSIDFIALLFASDIASKDLKNYFLETIDYIASDEEQSIKLKPIAENILKEYMIYV